MGAMIGCWIAWTGLIWCSEDWAIAPRIFPCMNTIEAEWVLRESLAALDVSMERCDGDAPHRICFDAAGHVWIESSGIRDTPRPP